MSKTWNWFIFFAYLTNKEMKMSPPAAFFFSLPIWHWYPRFRILRHWTICLYIQLVIFTGCERERRKFAFFLISSFVSIEVASRSVQYDVRKRGKLLKEKSMDYMYVCSDSHSSVYNIFPFIRPCVCLLAVYRVR